jgi:uncharacterized RDD family membrane protein YckC
MTALLTADTQTLPQCLDHADRAGTPCSRCGTFRCAECLEAGVCSTCLGSKTVMRPPRADEVVGFGRRAGARIIDMVLEQGLALFAGAFAGVAILILQELQIARPGALEAMGQHGFGFNLLAGSLSSFSAAATVTLISGASLGKLILGLQVVDANGGRPGAGGVLLRELGYYVDALFFGLVGKSAMESSPLSQRHGDRWGHTVVIRREAATGAARVSTALRLAGVAAGALVYGAVLAAFFIGSAIV